MIGLSTPILAAAAILLAGTPAAPNVEPTLAQAAPAAAQTIKQDCQRLVVRHSWRGRHKVCRRRGRRWVCRWR